MFKSATKRVLTSEVFDMIDKLTRGLKKIIMIIEDNFLYFKQLAKLREFSKRYEARGQNFTLMCQYLFSTPTAIAHHLFKEYNAQKFGFERNDLLYEA